MVFKLKYNIDLTASIYQIT